MSFHSDTSHEADPASGGSAAAGLGAAARVISGWLCLGATPIFAIMAVLTAASGSPEMPDMPDMAMPTPSPLGGMALMYLLMSLFHAAPWLKLVSGRQSGPPQP